MKTMTTKKLTGVIFTPQEFRELKQCVCCGKAENILEGELCCECKKVDYKNCEICEIVLRKGIYNFYSYDNREDKRESDTKFHGQKNNIREFITIKEIDNIENNTLCKNCIDWEKKMSDICWKCDNDFYNNKEHYKLNGNLCEECALIFN